jgi:hypothetical protein
MLASSPSLLPPPHDGRVKAVPKRRAQQVGGLADGIGGAVLGGVEKLCRGGLGLHWGKR